MYKFPSSANISIVNISESNILLTLECCKYPVSSGINAFFFYCVADITGLTFISQMVDVATLQQPALWLFRCSIFIQVSLHSCNCCFFFLHFIPRARKTVHRCWSFQCEEASPDWDMLSLRARPPLSWHREFYNQDLNRLPQHTWSPLPLRSSTLFLPQHVLYTHRRT